MKDVLSKLLEKISGLNFEFTLYMERVKDSYKKKYRELKIRLKKIPLINKIWKKLRILNFIVTHSKFYKLISDKLKELKEKFITPKVRALFWSVKRSTGYKFIVRFTVIIITLGVAIGIMNKGLDSNMSSASAHVEGRVPAVLHAGNDTIMATPVPTPAPTEGVAINTPEPIVVPSVVPTPTKKPVYEGFVATEDNTEWLAKARVNIYDENKFFTYKGRQYYKDDNFKTSYTGIDVSSYQGDIKWDRVKAHGVKYAMIRVGIRGYVSGKISEDSYFDKNMTEASKNGLNVGAYFFSQAINTKEAIEEANFVIEKVKKYNITMPIAYDGEHVSDASARTNIAKLNNKQRTDNCIAFCETIRKAGYVPMIYDNKSHLEGGFQLSRLNGYYIWYARYAEKPDYKYAYEMWQYTESAKVAGVKTLVDLSVCTIDFPSKIALMKKE